MQPTLVQFLTDAAHEERSCSVKRWMELRYDVFNRLFPHPIFGVNQCHNTFFAETLAYITGAQIPDHGKDEYLRVYLRWCRQNMV